VVQKKTGKFAYFSAEVKRLLARNIHLACNGAEISTDRDMEAKRRDLIN
jgi:hypothetical protein